MKVELHNAGDSYSLSAAVLIYTNPHRGHAFATKHDIEVDGGRPMVRPGTPFNEGDYRSLVKALAPAEQPGLQWHDQRVLAKGLGRVVWWTPPQKRAMFFSKSSHDAGTFDGRGVCPCPGLVFTTIDNALYVFAIRGTNAPTRETELCQAPFFNVWSRGQVCVGNAQVPQDKRDDLDAWERMFFGSHFTHPNFTEADRLTVGVPPTRFWKQQTIKPGKTFPDRVLFDLGLRVGDLLGVDAATRLRNIPKAKGEF